MKKFKKLLPLSLLLILSLLLFYCSKDNSTEPDPDPIEEVSSVPLFKLTSPLRSAFLQEGAIDDMNITIQGEACDDINTISGVTINGIQTSLSGTGDCKTFSFEANSSWGLNIIDGLAKNNLGDEVALVQSYIRSSEYSAAPTTSKSTNSKSNVSQSTSGAWLARFGNDFLDDKDRTDVDDFATAMNLVINKKLKEEVYPKIPGSYGSIKTNYVECGLIRSYNNRSGAKITKTGLDIGKVDLGLLAKGDNLLLEFEIGYTKLSLLAEAYHDWGCFIPFESGVEGAGSVSFDAVKVKVNLTSIKEGGSYKLVADMNTLVINFIGEKISLDITNFDYIDEFLSGLSTSVLNIFLNVFEDYFPLVILDATEKLEATFKQFGTTLPTISIPEPISINLIVDAKNDLINIGDGFIDLGVNTNVTPSVYKKSASQLTHGSIIGASTLPTFEGMNGSFGLGLKHDFINQVLWAVWAGGGFDISDGAASEIISALSTSSLNATINSIETTSPPIIMPGNLDPDIKIGIGDILVKANVQPSSLGLPNVGVEKEISVYVSIILNSKLQLNPITREMSFQLDSAPEIHVAIDGIARNAAVKTLEDQFAVTINKIIPARIFDVMKSIELPTIPIGGLDGVPAGTTWMLGNGLIDQTLGYSRLIGTVEVVEK